ncbi:MAG: Nif3-like dinuclear metal center hexameric protein [Calditerrivibrio sp.]|nr:Nif3-like dinuclear metal center hexameric protein [Calditerrivibrio sp.]
MTIKIDSIIAYIENKICDTSRYYEWDNNGLQVDSRRNLIDKVAFALDPTEENIKVAIKEGCGLLITHHPLFFGNVKNVSFTSPIGRKIELAIKNDISIYSYHTTLDLANYSLNDLLADKLEFNVLSCFEVLGNDKFYKFVVFVPKGYENRIIDVFESCDAGKIGNYSCCSFYTEGVGTFKPLEGTNPFIGKKGVLEEVHEYRLETIVPEKALNKLIRSVEIVHPYEEIAYDVYPLKINRPYGLGRIVDFGKNMDLIDLCEHILKKLNLREIRHNGLDGIVSNKGAILTGSGASYWKICRDKGIKFLITGDMKHHDALDAYENGIAVIDVGHFQTEKIFMNYLAETVKRDIGVEVVVIDEKSPIKLYVRKEDIDA